MQKRFFYLIAILSIFIFESCKPASKIQKPAVENVMIHALRWQEANPIFSQDPKDWTNGAYYTGVARAHRATQNKEFLDALTAMGKRNNWQPYEKFFHADDLVICYPYVYLKSIGINDADLAATGKVINDHLYKPHTWKDGPFEKEQVILWWWCDALFMAPPLITFYSMLEKNTAYLEDMYKYYKQTYNLLYDKEAKLFARDNRFLWTGREGDLKEKNGNKIFWSRGNGWVFAGLALLLEDLPKDYVHRAFFENLYKEMANKIKDIQPKDGLWRTSLLSPESFDHGEASGTGFFTFALAWGINNGLLDKAAFKPSVVNAWAALKKCQHEDGKVGWVQNIGADPRPAGFDSWQNFGTGAFLLAGSEVLKMK